MDEYIRISLLNDFIFCPRSIYFHNVYSQFENEVYYSTSQIVGLASHKTIDNKKYSNKKQILQGINVFSEELGIIGKIDLFDLQTKTLIERKHRIVKIYDGYLLQVYAQFFCLKEMGYEINKIIIRSVVDNKNYEIPLPTKKEKDKLRRVIEQMKSFSLDNSFSQNPNKCKKCIYRQLCDVYIDAE